ncbi:MAG: hypothetical protein M1476_04645, partial [Candidatus Thermoplasmatota archaeon]|nr:hypothetical protein [Candidatus Thermoplasmatota archaeon]
MFIHVFRSERFLQFTEHSIYFFRQFPTLIRESECVHFPWELHISEDNVYRSLDSIIAGKDEIEIDLFNTLKPDTSTVHYDLTSSYFEG